MGELILSCVSDRCWASISSRGCRRWSVAAWAQLTIVSNVLHGEAMLFDPTCAGVQVVHTTDGNGFISLAFAPLTGFRLRIGAPLIALREHVVHVALTLDAKLKL